VRCEKLDRSFLALNYIAASMMMFRKKETGGRLAFAAHTPEAALKNA
jgi:hypothetical protein